DIQFNAKHAADLAAHIEASRARQRRLGGALMGASAVFALVAGFAVARVLMGYAAMTRTRIAELERFNGRVAHDIRSPLGAVTFAIETVRRGGALDDAGQVALGRASRSIQHVTQVVEAMLVLARAGLPPEKGARVDVCAIAHDAIEDLVPE